MVTGGFTRTIKAAKDTFDDKDIAQGFVTTLCFVFNGHIESLDLQMQMIMINKPRRVECEGEQGQAQLLCLESAEVVGPADVMVEGHGIFAANTPIWKLPKSAFKFPAAMTSTTGGATASAEERAPVTQVKTEHSLQAQAPAVGQGQAQSSIVCFWLKEFNQHLAQELERHERLCGGGPPEVPVQQ